MGWKAAGWAGIVTAQKWPFVKLIRTETPHLAHAGLLSPVRKTSAVTPAQASRTLLIWGLLGAGYEEAHQELAITVNLTYLRC